MKKQFPFGGKESKKEERAEKKFGKAAYARGEKREDMPFSKGGKVSRKKC